MTKLILLCLALACVALTTAASTKEETAEQEIVRELLEGIVARGEERKREVEEAQISTATQQVRDLVTNIYELEEATVERNRGACMPMHGNCTVSRCCRNAVCQKSLSVGAHGVCVACLARGSRCGAGSIYGTNCCTRNACGPYKSFFLGCRN